MTPHHYDDSEGNALIKFLTIAGWGMIILAFAMTLVAVTYDGIQSARERRAAEDWIENAEQVNNSHAVYSFDDYQPAQPPTPQDRQALGLPERKR